MKLKIAALLLMTTLTGCMTQEEVKRQEEEQIRQAARESARTSEIYAEEMNKSAESKQERRQRMMDEASIVCRDGTAYLIGDSYESWSQGGIFSVPYIVDGVIGGCNGHKGQKIAVDNQPIEPAASAEQKVTF